MLMLSFCQDMAVKAAVVGYTEKYSPPAAGADAGEASSGTPQPGQEESSDDASHFATEEELDELERLDLEALVVTADADGTDSQAATDGEDVEGHEGARECSRSIREGGHVSPLE